MTEIKRSQKLTEDQIDEIVIAQADDDPAWEAPIIVNRTKRLKSVTSSATARVSATGKSPRGRRRWLLGFKGVWRGRATWARRPISRLKCGGCFRVGVVARALSRASVYRFALRCGDNGGSSDERPITNGGAPRQSGDRHDVKWEWVEDMTQPGPGSG